MDMPKPMNLVKVSISLLTLAMASYVSAQATVPSEEEKSALTVYMIQTHIDDPVFATDIDENLTFSVNSQRLSDETLITNTCLLTNLTQIGSGDRISPMYYRQGVDIALDANLYLVNSVYEHYGIQNLAHVLSKDSEQGLKTWATDFGLDLKFAEHCRNSRESGNSSYLKGYDNTDVYFLPRYIYERWLELGDETAQKITSSDVIGTWDYDSIKAMSDEYLLELEEQNKIKNELEQQFLSLAEEQNTDYMASLYLNLETSYNPVPQGFCTLDYSGEDGIAAIGYRLMGDDMLLDTELINYIQEQKVSLNYSDRDRNYFRHTFDNIGDAFINIKGKLKTGDKEYCNFFIDYPANILKLKNAIDRDVGSYTAIGKVFSKAETSNRFAINKGFDDFEQYSFASNINADVNDIESLKNLGINNQAEYEQASASMLASQYSEDTRVANILIYLKDLSAAKAKSMNILDYRTARIKEEEASAARAAAAAQKRQEEFAREYPYTATLTCGMSGGGHINISACFVGGKYGAETELEIRNGQDYQMYKAYNLRQAGSEYASGLEINLRNRFSLMAQNSSEYLVLTLEIVDNASGSRIYTESASQYGVVRYDR